MNISKINTSSCWRNITDILRTEEMLTVALSPIRKVGKNAPFISPASEIQILIRNYRSREQETVDKYVISRTTYDYLK